MSVIIKKILITSSLVSLLLFQIPFAFALSGSKQHELKAQISARYSFLNNDGTETDCLVTGNKTFQERREMQKKGCTLETLQNDNDIEVELTLKTSSGFTTIILKSKYYLMWVNSGLHAVNLLRNVPFVFTRFLTFHPIDSLKYLSFSVLYNIGLYQNAKNTLYPYLSDQLSSYFFPHSDKRNNTFDESSDYLSPNDSVSKNNTPEIQKWRYETHALIIGIDFFTWWKDSFIIGGFNIHNLILAIDLLNLASDMAL